jgi:hypothetical protein
MYVHPNPRAIPRVTESEGMIATLHALYIGNNYDRRGFGGTEAELAAWACRMGLLTQAEVDDLVAAVERERLPRADLH